MLAALAAAEGEGWVNSGPCGKYRRPANSGRNAGSGRSNMSSRRADPAWRRASRRAAYSSKAGGIGGGDRGAGDGVLGGGFAAGGAAIVAGAGITGGFGTVGGLGTAARTRPLNAAVRSLVAIRAREPRVLRPGSRTSPRVSWVTNQDGRYASMGRPGLIASHHS